MRKNRLLTLAPGRVRLQAFETRRAGYLAGGLPGVIGADEEVGELRHLVRVCGQGAGRVGIAPGRVEGGGTDFRWRQVADPSQPAHTYHNCSSALGHSSTVARYVSDSEHLNFCFYFTLLSTIYYAIT